MVRVAPTTRSPSAHVTRRSTDETEPAPLSGHETVPAPVAGAPTVTSGEQLPPPAAAQLVDVVES